MSELRKGYSEITVDHFEHPRNSGVLEDANAVGYMTNPVCGDAIAGGDRSLKSFMRAKVEVADSVRRHRVDKAAEVEAHPHRS